MTTIFEAMLALARKVSVVRQGAAEVDEATKVTLTCKTPLFTTDEFVGGTIFILSGDAAEESRVVEGYREGVFLFDDLSATIDIGDTFAVVAKDYPRDLLMQAVNQARRHLAPRIDEDTTLDTVAGQEEYDLPTGVTKVVEVLIANATTEPFYWSRNPYWDEVDDVIRFGPGKQPFVTGMKIMLRYRATFTDLVLDDDVIEPAIDDEALLWQSVVELCKMGMLLYAGDEKRQLNFLMDEAQTQLARTAPRQVLPSRDPRLADY